MARRNKRITRLRQAPHQVRPEDLDVVLGDAGFTARQLGTSHKVYTRGADRLTVPQRRPFLLATYVNQALALLGQGEEEEDDDDGSDD